jgi:hypothetical protein
MFSVELKKSLPSVGQMKLLQRLVMCGGFCAPLYVLYLQRGFLIIVELIVFIVCLVKVSNRIETLYVRIEKVSAHTVFLSEGLLILCVVVVILSMRRRTLLVVVLKVLVG